MDDVVAVAVHTDTDHVCYFVTWGRIQDAVDPTGVEQVVLAAAQSFATPGKPVTARICRTLQEARDAPYFYEAIISFAQQAIPFGVDTYEPWRASMNDAMRAGKHINFVGPTRHDVERGQIATDD